MPLELIKSKRPYGAPVQFVKYSTTSCPLCHLQDSGIPKI